MHHGADGPRQAKPAAVAIDAEASESGAVASDTDSPDLATRMSNLGCGG